MTQYPGHITFHPALPWETAKMHSNAHKNTQKCTMFPPCNVNKINHMRAVFGKKHPPLPPLHFSAATATKITLATSLRGCRTRPKNRTLPKRQTARSIRSGPLDSDSVPMSGGDGHAHHFGQGFGNGDAIFEQSLDMKFDAFAEKPLGLFERGASNTEARQVGHISAPARGSFFENRRVFLHFVAWQATPRPSIFQ